MREPEPLDLLRAAQDTGDDLAQVARSLHFLVLVWFLLVGGVRPVFELRRQRSRGRMPYSDADQIGRMTRVHPLAWVGVFLAVTVLALVTGGWLLARWLLPQ